LEFLSFRDDEMIFPLDWLPSQEIPELQVMILFPCRRSVAVSYPAWPWESSLLLLTDSRLQRPVALEMQSRLVVPLLSRVDWPPRSRVELAMLCQRVKLLEQATRSPQAMRSPREKPSQLAKRPDWPVRRLFQRHRSW
jgi:hypothetical protein